MLFSSPFSSLACRQKICLLTDTLEACTEPGSLRRESAAVPGCFVSSRLPQGGEELPDFSFRLSWTGNEIIVGVALAVVSTGLQGAPGTVLPAHNAGVRVAQRVPGTAQAPRANPFPPSPLGRCGEARAVLGRRVPAAWLLLLPPDIPACHQNGPVLLSPKRSRKTKLSLKVCSSWPWQRAGLRWELGLCLPAPCRARGAWWGGGQVAVCFPLGLSPSLCYLELLRPRSLI